jgi:4-hydroxy-tetrahydrodipicolinate reductase
MFACLSKTTKVLFAHGALKAALWARGKKPGLYTVADVLRLGDF